MGKREIPLGGTRLSKRIWDTLIPSDSTYDSICIILNERDTEERDRLTQQWREHKLEELNFIGIVGALLAGCLTSTGDWPTILGNGQTQPWTVKACWYSGIVCALFAVLTVAQQSMRLHRLCAHRDGLKRIRNCMMHRKLGKDGRYRPQTFRVYAWQVGPALLTASVLCMIIGMAIMLWVGASRGPYKGEREEWWDGNAKMAVTWTLILGIVILVFAIGQFTLVEDPRSSDEGEESSEG